MVFVKPLNYSEGLKIKSENPPANLLAQMLPFIVSYM